MGSTSKTRTIAAAALAAAVVAGMPLATSQPAAAAEPGLVVINELHYHDPVDTQDFLELHNPGTTAVDLGGACFTSGITGCFAAGTTLAPGGFLVAVDTPADYATAFPGGAAPALDYGGSLSNGGERVTLTGADGTTVLDTVEYDDAPPWPVTPDGDGPSLELSDPLADNDTAEPWLPSNPAPTPGAVNSRFGQGALPVIADAALGPVTAGQPTTVTATVSGAASVDLEVVVNFGSPQLIAMVEDPEGTWTAAIPAQPAGTLVRYRVRATSSGGTALLPAEGDRRAYRGVVVAPPAPSTPLPVIDWRISPTALQTLMANKFTNDYQYTVIAAGGEVWDGVEVRVQGSQKGRATNAKLSFKFKMPKGHPISVPGLTTEPVDEFVLDADPTDVTGTINVTAFSVYADSNPYVPQVGKVRVERNRAFHGLFTFIEEADTGWRTRVGLTDPGDEIYEPEGDIGWFQDVGSAEGLTPHFEKSFPDDGDNTSLYELIKVIDAPATEARAQRLRDLFDVPALVEYLAVNALIQHWDTTVHNFLLVRDGDTGRWRFVPADMDHTLGFPLNGSASTPNHARISGVYPFGPADLVSALRSDPEFALLYFRRLRTLADRYLAGGELASRYASLDPLVAPDLALDHQTWPRNFTAAGGRLARTNYLNYRRNDLLVTRRVAGEVPAAPTPGLPVEISAVVPAATGGAAHDLVELHNPSPTEAIDLSGWTISGAASATLPLGAVLPARGHLVVPGDQEASAGDRRSGTLVAGELADGVADAGGTITVSDAGGTTRGAVTVDGTGLTRPPTAGALTVEAAADQVEELFSSTAPIGLNVAVTNGTAAALPNVTVTAPRTTCGRSLGTLAAGASVTFSCATNVPRPSVDHSYVVTATSGSTVVATGPVQVRAYRHATMYYENGVPHTTRLNEVLLGNGGTASLAWTRPTSQQPARKAVVTRLAPGRAVPTTGALLPPTGSGSVPVAIDQPIRLGVATRSVSGTGGRSALTPWLIPRDTRTWPFAATDAQVRRIFADLMGRPANPTEVTYLSSLISNGTSPSTIVTSLLNQERWAVDVAPVVRLYAAYFGRLPDQAGLTYWVGRRRAGMKLEVISSAFAATTEFRTAYGTLSNTEFVRRVYRNVLGREADAAGLAHWRSRLDAGRLRGQVMTAFSEASEGKRKLAPLTGTALVWTALLGRTPTVAEAEPARAWLAAGGSLATVVDGVRTSDAYAARVGY